MSYIIDPRIASLGMLSIIPDEILMKCLSFLSPADLRIVSFINTKFCSLTSEIEEVLWGNLCKKHFQCSNLSTFTAKRSYQVLSDMKKGRYLLERVDINQVDVVALIGEEAHFGIETEKKQAALHIPPSLMHLSLPQEEGFVAYWRWNGRYLASTCSNQDFDSINGGEITIWDVKDGCLTPCQKINLENAYFIKHEWQKNQLVVMAIKDEEEDQGELILEEEKFVLQIWEEGKDKRWSLIYSFVLPYDPSYDILELRIILEDVDFFAWDGEWLAFIPVIPDLLNPKRANTIDIWRKNENGILEKTCEKDLGSSVSSVKWHGKFLFAGDVSGNVIIWDRESDSIQTISCRFPFYPSLPEKKGDLERPMVHVHHFIFLNPLILITTYWGKQSGEFSTSISLWEQGQDSMLKKVDDLICMHYSELVTVLNDETSFLILERYKKNLLKMSFGNSYQKIFEQIAHNYQLMAASTNPLQQADVWHNQKRFSRMPKSQKSDIEKELRQFLIYQEMATNKKKKDDKESCVAILQAIRLYINKTYPQPLTSTNK